MAKWLVIRYPEDPPARQKRAKQHLFAPISFCPGEEYAEAPCAVGVAARSLLVDDPQAAKCRHCLKEEAKGEK